MFMFMMLHQAAEFVTALLESVVDEVGVASPESTLSSARPAPVQIPQQTPSYQPPAQHTPTRAGQSEDSIQCSYSSIILKLLSSCSV